MKITKMKAKWGRQNYEIFVSPRMKNEGCDDNQCHYGWWYCVVGGEVGTFVTVRPRSGCQLKNLPEHDIFNVYGPMDKERFIKILEDRY